MSGWSVESRGPQFTDTGSRPRRPSFAAARNSRALGEPASGRLRQSHSLTGRSTSGSGQDTADVHPEAVFAHKVVRCPEQAERPGADWRVCCRSRIVWRRPVSGSARSAAEGVTAPRWGGHPRDQGRRHYRRRSGCAATWTAAFCQSKARPAQERRTPVPG